MATVASVNIDDLNCIGLIYRILHCIGRNWECIILLGKPYNVNSVNICTAHWTISNFNFML